LFAAAKNKKRKTAFEDDLQSKNKFWRYLQQSRIRQHVQHYAVIVNNKIRQNRKVKKRLRDNRREVIFFLSFQTNITNNIHNLFDKNRQYPINLWMSKMSGGQLLEIRLLDNHLLDTFGRKSIARHKIYQLLESS
jgi:hypothetical protein